MERVLAYARDQAYTSSRRALLPHRFPEFRLRPRSRGSVHADIAPEIQTERLERRHQCLDVIVGGPKYTFFFDTAMTPPKSFHPVEVARTGHGVRETRLNVGLEAPGCAKIRSR